MSHSTLHMFEQTLHGTLLVLLILKAELVSKVVQHSPRRGRTMEGGRIWMTSSDQHDTEFDSADGSLDPYLLEVFVQEIEKQCFFALVSFHRLVYQVNKPDPRSGANQEIFLDAHSFATHAAAVSRRFIPESKKVHSRDKRGLTEDQLSKLTDLRAVRTTILFDQLGVPSDLSVFDRQMRNHLEHYDERLEVWAVTSRRRNHVDSNVSAPGMIAGIDESDFFRNIDPTSLSFSFRGETFDLARMAHEIQAIHNASITWLRSQRFRR